MTNSFKRELGGASKSSSQMGGEAKISLISCGCLPKTHRVLYPIRYNTSILYHGATTIELTNTRVKELEFTIDIVIR
jgi:hypothetical protein